MWLNVGSGRHSAPRPWVNLDLLENTDPLAQPDLRIAYGDPFPRQDGTCERVLLSHVLEHVAWRDVAWFLGETRRVLHRDGQVVVAGPDVHRAIRAYCAGQIDWELMTSVMEHGTLGDEAGHWPNARHQWSCSEGRVRDALEQSGFSVEACDGAEAVADGWALVGYEPKWQFCLKARRA